MAGGRPKTDARPAEKVGARQESGRLGLLENRDYLSLCRL